MAQKRWVLESGRCIRAINYNSHLSSVTVIVFINFHFAVMLGGARQPVKINFGAVKNHLAERFANMILGDSEYNSADPLRTNLE